MIIIATVGAIDANSYATLIEADAYHDTRLHNSDWTSASDQIKEKAMIWSTRLLDINFYWEGSKATEEQALDWPRFGMIYKNGYYVSDSIVPDQVKEAESELAFMLITEDRTVFSEPCGVKKADLESMKVEIDKFDRPNVLSNSVISLIQEFGSQRGAGLAHGNMFRKLVR